ncbi:tetratricopeptide repeat protein [Lacibacter sp.]|uniref:tetratricopeptide repeat protein n=1 Tax=Lacibacter sp. TaxID=1915409 RepID=UPI002B4B7DF0|nr:tetratricopeptide repeat protein [Lacibacter sp.]HLP35332.1 tetratricopeptide repeat protein [Lacibacter sp.]
MKYILISALLTLSLFCAAQTSEDQLKKARDFYSRDDYKNAMSLIDLILANDSINFDGLFMKANILYKTKDYENSFVTYSKLIKLYPDEPIPLSQRGLLLRTVQEFEYSVKDFDKALLLKMDDTLRLGILVNRGAAKLSMREFKGAYNDFMMAFEIDSLNIGVLNNLAAVCDEVGKGDQTLVYLHKIIQIDSTFSGTYVNLGFKYQEMGKYKKAIEFFDKAVYLDPNEPLAYSNRSYNRLKLGDFAGALIDINKSIALYPENPYAFRNRALIFIEQKKTTEACKDIAKAIDLGFTKMYGTEVEELKSKHCK